MQKMTIRGWLYFGMRCISMMLLVAVALVDPLRAIALVAILFALPRVLQIPEKAIRGRQIERAATLLVLFAAVAGAWLIAAYVPALL